MFQGGFALKKIASLLIGLFLLFSAATVTWAQDTVHIVKKGDTLWDITRQYLSNPWKWPVVWSNNEEITNPHLIFPGDRVVISSKGGKTIITVFPAKGGEPSVYTPAGVAGIKEKTFMISPQYSSYMYSPTVLTGSGAVIQKVDVGALMTRDEDIIVKSNSELAPGKGITIVTKVTEVMDNDRVVGYLYKVIGLAKVKDSQGNISKALVADSSQEIKAGDIIFDDLKTIAPMKVSLYEPSTGENARVVDLFGGNVQGSSYLDLVFLNVGKGDGVDKGALVSIYKEHKVEGENVVIRDYQGNALVLQATDGSCVALVTESLSPIQRGFVLHGPK